MFSEYQNVFRIFFNIVQDTEYNSTTLKVIEMTSKGFFNIVQDTENQFSSSLKGIEMTSNTA